MRQSSSSRETGRAWGRRAGSRPEGFVGRALARAQRRHPGRGPHPAGSDKSRRNIAAPERQATAAESAWPRGPPRPPSTLSTSGSADPPTRGGHGVPPGCQIPVPTLRESRIPTWFGVARRRTGSARASTRGLSLALPSGASPSPGSAAPSGSRGVFRPPGHTSSTRR